MGQISTEIRDGMYLNRAYEPLLTENNLQTFDSFLRIPTEETIKKVRDDRHTARVSLLREGKPHAAYLKLSSYSWVKNLVNAVRKFTRQRGSLVHEYRNLVKLREIGVPSITPVAAGTRVRGFRCESFLLTDALGPTVKLEDYVPGYFSRPFSKEQASEKRLLIENLAGLTRKMHDGGVNHRDYYLCHIHILPDASPWPKLFVIDLNRADRRGTVGTRWKVKDLAALNYSAPTGVFSQTDRLRFFKAYMGTGRLSKAQRGLIRRILGKSERIARHAERSKARDRRYMEEAQKRAGSREAGCAGDETS
jgi:heptose I phosphotransferase